MKRILTLSIALSLFVNCFAGANTVVPTKSKNPNANEILVPIGKNGEKISLMDLTLIKAKDFQTLTGKKMSVAEKVGFKMAQKQLRGAINAKGEINKKALEKMTAKAMKAEGKERQYLKLWLILLGAAIVFSILGWVVHPLWYVAYLAWLGSAVFFVLWLIEKAGGM